MATPTPSSSSSSSSSSEHDASKRQDPLPPAPPPPLNASSSGSGAMQRTIIVPKLTMFKRGAAWNSSQVDERCFIYCTQTSRGRANLEDPVCRTICFRRVFGHEVSDGSYDASQDPNGHLKPQEPVPLPGEGQQPDTVSDIGEVEINDKTRYWKEGRYIWGFKGYRTLTHEKIDTMVLPLDEYAKWMRQKELIAKANSEERKMGHMDESWLRAIQDQRAKQVDWDQPPMVVLPLYAIRDSFLLRVTPVYSFIQETLHQKLSFILGPTKKVLDIANQSYQEGAQRRFWEKAYEQATNGSTLRLIRNAWNRHEMLWKKLEEERDEGARKKKGGDETV